MGTMSRFKGDWLREGLPIRGTRMDWQTPTLALRRFGGRARIRLPQLDPDRRPSPRRVLFVSQGKADRAVMAAAFFNEMADPARVRAISAATEPEAALAADVVSAMTEVGVIPSSLPVHRLSASLAMSAAEVVIIGSADSCPFVPGVRVHDWPLEDPTGKSPARLRRVRNQIRRRVVALVERNAWRRDDPSRPANCS